MKIDEKLVSQIQTQVFRSNRTLDAGNAFAKILADTDGKSSDGTSTVTNSTSASSLMETSAVAGILAAQASGPEARVEQALSALDQYAQGLSDGNSTLKDLAPLVDKLQTEADRMKELSGSLPEGHGLKGLADQVAILASVEAMKFNRGDFS
ncbi:MAG: hypothetical protein V1816_22120 [Pseudomonadota bacterium]